jgi:hypothetical protein
MIGVDRVPAYVAETAAAAARLQEMTSAGQYAALVGRAERLLEGMFTVETNVDPGLMAKIAIRERFVAPRVKQAILMVATWQLINDLANAWSISASAKATADRRKRAAPSTTREAVFSA